MKDDRRPPLAPQYPGGGNGFACQLCTGGGYVRACGVSLCDGCVQGIPVFDQLDAPSVRGWVANQLRAQLDSGGAPWSWLCVATGRFLTKGLWSYPCPECKAPCARPQWCGRDDLADAEPVEPLE